jgi:uncharacterized protein YjbI with pentapeptide repeats
VVPAADVGTSVTVSSAVVGAVVAILGVVGFQNRRVKLSAIRAAFNDAVTSLSSDNRDQQLAGAVLLRRFFDPSSEFGIRDILGRRRRPYSQEAVGVMTAVLRGLEKGDLQKVLADGLAYAPTLESADLQYTNLQGAYLSPQRRGATLDRADFYRANLGGGSLKGASAVKAQFYQARLRDTVFAGADLRFSNFFEADLTGAVFSDAKLEGADFRGARNVPRELATLIGDDGMYMSQAPAPKPSKDSAIRPSVFFSVPSERTPSQQNVCEQFLRVLIDVGFEPQYLPRSDYPLSDAMSEIYRRIKGCAGVVVLGFRPVSPAGVEGSVTATPWVHVEAGIAYGCSLPLLLVRESGVCSGAFEDAVRGQRTHIVDLRATGDDATLAEAMRPWAYDVKRFIG